MKCCRSPIVYKDLQCTPGVCVVIVKSPHGALHGDLKAAPCRPSSVLLVGLPSCPLLGLTARRTPRAPQDSKLSEAAWAAFTEGEGDGYGGPLAPLFAETPACSAKGVLANVSTLSWPSENRLVSSAALACGSHPVTDQGLVAGRIITLTSFTRQYMVWPPSTRVPLQQSAEQLDRLGTHFGTSKRHRF